MIWIEQNKCKTPFPDTTEYFYIATYSGKTENICKQFRCNKKHEGNRRRIQIDKDKILELLDEVVKMYFDYNCSIEEAIEWAREVVKYENKN